MSKVQLCVFLANEKPTIRKQPIFTVLRNLEKRGIVVNVDDTFANHLRARIMDLSLGFTLKGGDHLNG